MARGPLLHLAGKGWQLRNGRVVAVGGLIVAIIGTIATVVGVWLQFRQPQPPEPTTTVNENTTTPGPDTVISEKTTEPSETDTTSTSEVEIAESAEPLFTTSTLQEAFGFVENGNCRDVNYGYAENDVAVQRCTFPNSPVYFFLHKYGGVSAADYLAQYPSSLEYRSGFNGPDGQLCIERYLNTFTGDDDVAYNSKIVHFLPTPFLVEINAPAELYSRADIEQITVRTNSDHTC